MQLNGVDGIQIEGSGEYSEEKTTAMSAGFKWCKRRCHTHLCSAVARRFARTGFAVCSVRISVPSVVFVGLPECEFSRLEAMRATGREGRVGSAVHSFPARSPCNVIFEF